MSTPSTGDTTKSRERIPPWKVANFRWLWIGQVLSETGSGAASLGYTLLVLTLTHSAVLAGVVGTADSLVQLALRLPAGALVDRWDCRFTLLVCDGVRTLALAVLAIVVLIGDASWPLVLGVAVVDGAGSVFFSPAEAALLPAIIPKEQLDEAWAANEARGYTANLAGPAIGGFLFSIGRALPFLADGVSYAISVLTIGQVRGTFRADRGSEVKTLRFDIVDGLRHVLRSALLRAAIVQAALANFSFAGAMFTIVVEMRRHGVSAAVIGGVQASVAVGGIVGALLATRVRGRFRLVTLVASLTTSGSILFGVAAVLLPSPSVAVPLTFLMLLAPTVNAALFAAILRGSPPELHGRVINTAVMAATGLAALAPLLAGVLVARVNEHLAMGAFALLGLFSAILTVTQRGLRQVKTAPAETAI